MTALAATCEPILLALSISLAISTLGLLGVRWAEQHDERLRARAERRPRLANTMLPPRPLSVREMAAATEEARDLRLALDRRVDGMEEP